MIDNLKLESYINQRLDVDSFQDYAPNGLQVQGRTCIKKIATAVSASAFVINTCIQEGVDALLVHHGYFWKGENPCLRGLKYQRIAGLIKHEINLFAYHLPLDAHSDFGNNACIAQKLGIEVHEKRMWNHMRDILWLGSIPSHPSAEVLGASLKSIYGPQVQHVGVHHAKIQSLAWCSGAGQDGLEQLALSDIQAFISGEYSERTYHLAQEAGIDFYAIGHHASEKDGIKHLGQIVAEAFKLQHQFIDENNPF